jgi:hypothetical protein
VLFRSIGRFALAALKFDIFPRMEENPEHQQNLGSLLIAVLVVGAVSNRMECLAPLAPSILREIIHSLPRSPRRGHSQ